MQYRLAAPDLLRISNNEEFIAVLEPDGHDFWIDGEFSHCGVDSADLVKVDGEWKVANFMWTVETEGCPTAPSD